MTTGISELQLQYAEGMEVSELSLEEEYRVIEQARESLESFAPLYDLYYDRIFLYLYRLCGDRSAAEDLAADTFLKVMQNLDRFKRQKAPFVAWIYRIAFNTFISQCRKNKIRRLFGMRTQAEEEQVIHQPEQSNRIDRAMISNALAVLIKRLKPIDQMIITLRYFENLSHREIAFAAGITEANTRSRMQRALSRLQTLIRTEAPYLESVLWED